MRSIKGILNIRKSSKICFSNEALSALADLLAINIPLSEALFIVSDKKEQSIITSIEKRIKNGERISEVFADHIRGDVALYFRALINYLSFKEAILLAITTSGKKKVIIEKMIKETVYPLALLTFSVIGIYLFNAFAFEPLIQSVASFSPDQQSLYIIKQGLDIMISALLFIIVIAAAAFLYFRRKKHHVWLYVRLNRYFPSSMIKEYLSSQFVLYLVECHKIGVRTKDSIAILKSLKDQPLISFLAYHVDDAFLKGKSYEEAVSNRYLDKNLSAVIKIGITTGKLDIMMANYLETFIKRFSRHCRLWAKILQIISYALIGIIIMFIYQILFIPMSVIGGFK